MRWQGRREHERRDRRGRGLMMRTGAGSAAAGCCSSCSRSSPARIRCVAAALRDDPVQVPQSGPQPGDAGRRVRPLRVGRARRSRGDLSASPAPASATNADARALHRGGAVGLRLQQRERAVLLPRRPEGLPRSPSSTVRSPLRRAGRLRAGVRDRPRRGTTCRTSSGWIRCTRPSSGRAPAPRRTVLGGARAVGRLPRRRLRITPTRAAAVEPGDVGRACAAAVIATTGCSGGHRHRAAGELTHGLLPSGRLAAARHGERGSGRPRDAALRPSRPGAPHVSDPGTPSVGPRHERREPIPSGS